MMRAVGGASGSVRGRCFAARLRVTGRRQRAAWARGTRWRAYLALIAVVSGLMVSAAVPPAAQADPAAPGAGQFVPVAPTNIVRSATGVGWSGQIQPGQTQSVPAIGVGTVPST